MLRSTSTDSIESLFHLRIKICSVRLPTSIKLVDICVIIEIDNKYNYRTELIRKPAKTNSTPNPSILINETLDTLVSTDSKINLKIQSPTRLFGSNDLGHIALTLKSIIDDYYSKHQNINDEQSPSYHLQLPFQNSASSSSNFFRFNENNNNHNNASTGIIEVVFFGSILKSQQQQPQEQTLPRALSEPVRRLFEIRRLIN